MQWIGEGVSYWYKNVRCLSYAFLGALLAVWQCLTCECDYEVAGFNLTHGYRVPSLRSRLLSTIKSCGVNGHTTKVRLFTPAVEVNCN